MSKRVFRYLSVLLILIVGMETWGVDAADMGIAASTATVKTLDRDLEPVVIVGQTVVGLTGTPVNQLFVYSYAAGVWHQIPAQVDEVAASGVYAAFEDGLMDGNDEMVFMAKDLDDRAPSDTSPALLLPGVTDWYEITVTDPINPTHRGWAYLVKSSLLTQTFTDDYVNFNPATHRLTGETYSLGFATPKPWADYLTLGNSAVDLLDRNKTRLYCSIPIICPITEELAPQLPDDLIRDGPVRVIVRDGRVLGYRSMLRWSTTVTIPPTLAGNVRISIDFSPEATGAAFYSLVAPAGVTVDGIPDNIPSQPVSAWWQLTTASGTLIQVADIASLTGTPAGFYMDNSAIDSTDTGDRQHYGDVGLYIINPAPTLISAFNLYVLPGLQSNVGATYDAFFRHPLLVTARRYSIYLPLMVR